MPNTPEISWALELSSWEKIRHDLLLHHAPQELKQLNLPSDQLKDRMAAIARLDMYINDETRFARGYNEAGMWNFLKDLTQTNASQRSIQEQMKDIRALLLRAYKPEDWNTFIETHLSQINSDGSANINMIRTTMSKRVFLQRIVGPSMTARILRGAHEKVEELTKNEIEQKSRFEQLLLRLEMTQSDGWIDWIWKGMRGKKGIQQHIFHTRQLLEQNKLADAKKYLNTHISGKIEGFYLYEAIASQENFAKALRILGDTSGNAHIQAFQEEMAKGSDGSWKALYDSLNQVLSQDIPSEEMRKAENAYDAALQHLPPGDPDRIFMEAYPNETKHMLAVGSVLQKTVSEYIKQHGSEDLPDILKDFDDMKGLYGTWNFTDENAKLVRDMAVMVASFIVTAGAGAVLGGVAASARTIAVATTISTNGSKTAKVATFVPRVAATWVAVTATKAQRLHAAMNTGFLSQAVANGFVFTASQETLHALFPQQGDQTVDFFRFAESVGKNTAMFAAFAGMEKFVTGPWVERYLKGVSAATPIGKIGETLILTAGDVAAMQILHAAETGNLEFGWEALFVALAFRIGMKGASERFPKLKEKFSKKTPQDQQKVVNEVQAKGEQPQSQVRSTSQPSVSSQTQVPWKNSPKTPNPITLEAGDSITITFPQGTQNQTIQLGWRRFRFFERQGWWRDITDPTHLGEVFVPGAKISHPGIPQTWVSGPLQRITYTWKTAPAWQVEVLRQTQFYEFTYKPRSGVNAGKQYVFRLEWTSRDAIRIYIQDASSTGWWKQISSLKKEFSGEAFQNLRQSVYRQMETFRDKLASTSQVQTSEIPKNSSSTSVNTPTKTSEIQAPRPTVFSWREQMMNALNTMEQAPAGTSVTMRIWNHTIGEWGVATYVKEADGKWHHMASNISATSMADDVLQLLRTRDGTMYLSHAAAGKLSVESIQLEYPTPLRSYSPSSQLQSLQTLDAILKPDPKLTRFYGTWKLGGKTTGSDIVSVNTGVSTKAPVSEGSLSQTPKASPHQSSNIPPAQQLYRTPSAESQTMPKTSEKAPFSDVTVQPKKPDQRYPLTSWKETWSRAGYSVSSAFPGMAGWSVLREENPAWKTISDIVDEVVAKGVGWVPLAATTANQTQPTVANQTQAPSSQAQAPSSQAQATALNQVSGVPTSSLPLNYARISKPDTWAALTKERREAISRMWQKTKFWNKVEVQWDELSDAQKNTHQIIWTALSKPSVENVYHLQKYIGMQEGDVYNGRDGILGKHTLKKLQQFLNNLKYPQP